MRRLRRFERVSTNSSPSKVSRLARKCIKRQALIDQDQPYWPHANAGHQLSAWIALVDVPVERGCMTFIPGSFTRTDLRAQDLLDATDLFEACPDLMWDPRVTIPLRAGDCTFHHSLCAHMATPNLTDEPRVAHVVIYMDAATTYVKQPHMVTDPLQFEEGQRLEGDLFPAVTEFSTILS